VNDFYLTRKELLNFISKNASEIKGNVLDIGCGEKPYEKLFNATSYMGIDIESTKEYHASSKVDVFYNGLDLPFESNTFDTIVCFEVLEHVFEPERIVKEMFRVLKPGGKIMLTTPFIWNEHEIPYDFGRYTYFGLNHLFAKNGFKVIHQKRILSGLALFIVLTSLYVREGQEALKKLFSSNSTIGKLGRVMIYLFFRPIFLCFNLLGIVCLLLPKSERFYFNNGLIAQKIS
jgi:SAM-dependent methyltransferase